MNRFDYSDIIDLPAHQSKTHPHMANKDRAAQFSPFAALVGYEDVLEEEIRETEEKVISYEDQSEIIDRKIAKLGQFEANHPFVKVTYFVPDGKKEGGHYIVFEGNFLKIDPYERKMSFLGGFSLPLSDIRDLESEVFETE